MTVTGTSVDAGEAPAATIRWGIGTSAPRPDGEPKVTGSFVYSSDEHHEGELWGVTVRSPHPRARITSIDTSIAEGVDGVAAVLTHVDVPGSKTYGMKVADQPVLAVDEVRYQGQPVAVVAATHPDLARRAAALVEVDYEVLEPELDPEEAVAGRYPQFPDGGLARHITIVHGDVGAARPTADVVVSGRYELGTQDPAFLGPESGLAVPLSDGGVELYVSCQNLHLDHQQVAASLGLPGDRVRLVLSGVGGAFGGKEDLNVHIHACMLALRTGRPVRMVYNREESFVGHVHRHPATADVELGATADGDLVFSRVRLVLDGGAYTSTSQIVIANGSYFAAGAYRCDNVRIDGYAAYTNTPPRGAMRGFGAVQSCYAIESAMDVLARALGMHPLELRRRNAIGEGDVLPTGQAVDGPAPTDELLRYLQQLPLPPEPDPATLDPRARPGAVGNVTHGEGMRRGVGYALGMKAIGFSGGVDDTSTAQVTLWLRDGAPVAEVYCAATELGQGIVTLETQVVRTELGVDEVVLRDKDTLIAEAGASSASRQSWMSCGAILGACAAVRAELLERAGALVGEDPALLRLDGPRIVRATDNRVVVAVADVLGPEPLSHTFTYHHRPTEPVDEEGQGDAHVAFAYAAHRVVVDVDVELGLVRVVEIATAQDVGRALNPIAVEGQIEGGTVQGLGLALMEELQLDGGRVLNPSFTDYLIPTMADVPPMQLQVFEFPHPDSPYGLNGVGEPPNLSSTPAVVNALRDATGLELPRSPVRPADLVVTR
ncbi:MAG: xanthine dehydrogenase family protein molybdopterin-binding subunit [Acidimicrobiales bacterium]